MKNVSLSDQNIQQYRDLGYLILPGMLSSEIVDRVFAEITAVIQRRPDVPDDLIQYEPSARGKPWIETGELDIRKLYRMAKHLEFFRELAFHPPKPPRPIRHKADDGFTEYLR